MVYFFGGMWYNEDVSKFSRKRIYECLAKKTALDEAIDKIKQHTRNYAKRQITFFKKLPNLHYLNVEDNVEDFILEEISKN